MRWSKRAVLAAALVGCPAPALAQVVGHPLEVSGGAGIINFDTRARIKDAATFGASLGIRVTPWVTFEIPGVAALSKSKINPSTNHNFAYVGGDLRWNMRPGESRAVPYFLTGFGLGLSHSSARTPEKTDEPAGTLGLGLLYNIGGPRTYLRLQARAVMMRDRTPDVVDNFAATAALHYVFGGKYKDQDLDGVRDWLDKCPDTPIGAKVDAHGCPIDSDRDSVFDGLDKCPNTPPGCKVDASGCPIDSDGDGVCDGLDQCTNTPKGAIVDAKGCPSDADGDGVYDGIDKCPDTPKGAVVDENGCPKDSDGDGVPDGIDKCPNTAPGVPVGPDGCVTEAGQREMELMDTGMIRLQGVVFEPGKADVLDTAKPALDTIGQVLSGWPTVKFEVGVHTDNTSPAGTSLRLSGERAKAVLGYMQGKAPSLDQSRVLTKGYGSTRPIADNTTEQGRALNRRLEFKVLDMAAFKTALEQRRTGKKAPSDSSSAPRDTTR